MRSNTTSLSLNSRSKLKKILESVCNKKTEGIDALAFLFYKKYINEKIAEYLDSDTDGKYDKGAMTACLTYMFCDYYEGRLCVEHGFVNELIVYKPLDDKFQEHLPSVRTYNTFVLTVSNGLFGNRHELVVSYEGLMYIYQTPLARIPNFTDLSIKRVLIDGIILDYRKHKQVIDNNLYKAFPVINYMLKDQLGLKFNDNPTVKKSNTGTVDVNKDYKSNNYVKKEMLVSKFREHFLLKEILEKYGLQIGDNFIDIDDKKIGCLEKEAASMIIRNRLGNPIKTVNPADFKKPTNAPFLKGNEKKLELRYFFIYPNNAEGLNALKKIRDAFAGNLQLTPNIQDALTQPAMYIPTDDIAYNSLNTCLDDINMALDGKVFEINKYRYIAIYISTINKDDTSDEHYQYTYARIKETLINRNISMQGIYQKRVDEYSFKYHMSNIYAAILAKSGGAPWAISASYSEDLIIGVGAFKSGIIGKRYIGSAIMLDSNGIMKDSDCMQENDPNALAARIKEAIITFIREHKTTPKTIYIHFYKKMGRKQWEPIYKTLKNLEEKTRIIVATIYKNSEHTLFAYDYSNGYAEMPKSGTYVYLGEDRHGRTSYLLFNNTKYDENFQLTIYNIAKKLQMPMKIELECKNGDKDITKDECLTVIKQIYQLSRMNWGSVDQGVAPITVKYPEMIAKQVPFFKSTTIPNPDFGRKNLWFI